MTKTQRTILIFLPVQAGVIFLFYYLTLYWFIGSLLQVAITFFLMRKLLSGGNRPIVLAKSAQPILFVIAASFYSMILVQIYGVDISYFVALSVAISALYCLLTYAVLRTSLPPAVASIISIAQLALCTNLLVLSVAYWRLPGFVVLPIVFIVTAFVALWWMIETRRALSMPFAVASVFALIVSELVWAYSHWVVLYQLPRLNIVFAQPAIIVTALAYSVGGIYYARQDKPAKLQVMVEYGAVFVILFIITLVFTRFVGGV